MAQGQTAIRNRRWRVAPDSCHDALSETPPRKLDKDFTHLAASLHLRSFRGSSDGLGTQHSATRRAAIFHYLPHAVRNLKQAPPSRLVPPQFDESERPGPVSGTETVQMSSASTRWQDWHIGDIFCHTERDY